MPKRKHSAISLAIVPLLLVLIIAGCSLLDKWPRLEKDIERLKLLDEWGKVVDHLRIDGGKAVLSQAFIEWDTDETLTHFSLEFYLPTDGEVIQYNVWTGDWSEERRLRIDQRRKELTPPLEGPKMAAVLSALDEYGMRRLVEGMEGDVSLWVLPESYEEEDLSAFQGPVYLLKGKVREPVTEAVTARTAVKISISIMIKSKEGEKEVAKPGTPLIYVIEM